MPRLSPEALDFYHEHGYYAPIPVISAAQAAGLRRRLEAYEAGPQTIEGGLRNKSHLLFTWLDELIRNENILDAVESILGPNILCWGSSFFIKEARNPAFVSWHQDSTYWGLDPADIVTAWVALSDSDLENGAMRVIPGTHKSAQLAHRDTFSENNLLSRGQEIAVDVNESEAKALVLRPGEMSLHHVRLVHGSEPNPSARRRIGFAIRYLPTMVRQTAGMTDAATLVRGVDNFGHFLPEQRPEHDASLAAVAHHAEITGATKTILMRGAQRSSAM
jgi:chlorinating enzyme